MRPSPTPTQLTNVQNTSAKKSLRPLLLRGATLGLIAVTVLGTTGCKSMPFSIPKPTLPKLAMPSMPSLPKLGKPDVSKLAFWKSENLMPKKGNLPKPPSLNFDPTPLERAVASNEGSARKEFQSLRSGIASTRDELTKPIREPYKIASKTASDSLASSSLSIDPKITKAQRDFQAALAGSSIAIEKSIGGKVADLKSAGNDFQMPGSSRAVKTNVDKSLIAVNKSLYDAQGQLASKASNTFGATKSKAGDAGDTQLSLFEQRLTRAAEKTKAAPATIAKSATNAASNAFGGITLPKTPAASTSLASKSEPTTVAPAATAAVSSEVAELKAQLAQMRADQQQLIEQQQLAAMNKVQPVATQPLATAFNNSTPAREFVANLPAQSAPRNSALPPSAPATRPAPTYPQMYPSSAPVRTASAGNNGYSNAPQNVLRGNFSPVAAQPASYPATGTQTPTAPAGSTEYPSTPYKAYGAPPKYSANTTPSHVQSTHASQASFQENGDSNLVITASTPVEPAKRHVSEVNIPDAVLQGTSNYAPGTVHPLR